MAIASIPYDGAITDLLELPEIAAFFYLRISGIPIIFCSGPLPDSAAWRNTAGFGTWGMRIRSPESGIDELHLALDRLIVSGLEAISARAEVKSGLGIASSATFRIWESGTDPITQDAAGSTLLIEDGLMLRLLAKSLAATDGRYATTLAATVSAGDSPPFNMSVASGTSAALRAACWGSFWLPDTTYGPGGHCFVGRETFRIDEFAAPAGAVEVIERGCYGSWRETHRHANAGESFAGVSGSGQIIGNWPIVWAGRAVEVWMAFGQAVDGAFVPYERSSGAPMSTRRVEQQIFAGWLENVEEDGCIISLKCAGLEQAFARQVPARGPQADAIMTSGSGSGWAEQRYAATGMTGLIFWQWQFRDATTPVQMGLHRYGAGDPIHETADQILTRVVNQINSPGSSVPAPHPTPGALVESAGVSFDDGRYRIRIYSGGHLGWWLLLSFDVGNGAGAGCLLRHLGFRGNDVMPTRSWLRGAGKVLEWDAPEAPLALWLPGLSRGQGGLSSWVDMRHDIYYSPNDENFQPNPGWGAASTAMVRLGDHGLAMIESVAQLAAANVWRLRIRPDTSLLTGAPRWPWNDIMIEQGSGSGMEVSQCVLIAFSGRAAHIGDALLYLWCSGSGAPGATDATYDRGWYGTGLGLPSRFLDIAGINEIGGDGVARDAFIFAEPTEMRRFLADELRLDQLLLMASPNWREGHRCRITLLPTIEPQEAALGEALDVDEAIMITTDGLASLDRSEGNVINSLSVEIGYDHVKKKYAHKIEQTHVTSQETWGATPTMNARVMSIIAGGSIGGVAAMRLAAARSAARIFDRFALPYEILKLSIASPKAWAWRPGDVVSVSSRVLPKLDDGDRGLTDMPARIYEITHRHLGGPWASEVVAIARAALGYRRSFWAPSALIVGWLSNTEMTLAPHAFSAAGERVDVSWFGDALGGSDYVIRIWRRGNTTTTTAVVDRTDPSINYLRLTAAVATASYPAFESYITLVEYPAQTSAAARRFVCFSYGSPDALPPDRPFIYQE